MFRGLVWMLGLALALSGCTVQDRQDGEGGGSRSSAILQVDMDSACQLNDELLGELASQGVNVGDDFSMDWIEKVDLEVTANSDGPLARKLESLRTELELLSRTAQPWKLGLGEWGSHDVSVRSSFEAVVRTAWAIDDECVEVRSSNASMRPSIEEFGPTGQWLMNSVEDSLGNKHIEATVWSSNDSATAVAAMTLLCAEDVGFVQISISNSNGRLKMTGDKGRLEVRIGEGEIETWHGFFNSQGWWVDLSGDSGEPEWQFQKSIDDLSQAESFAFASMTDQTSHFKTYDFKFNTFGLEAVVRDFSAFGCL